MTFCIKDAECIKERTDNRSKNICVIKMKLCLKDSKEKKERIEKIKKMLKGIQDKIDEVIR